MCSHIELYMASFQYSSTSACHSAPYTRILSSPPTFLVSSDIGVVLVVVEAVHEEGSQAGATFHRSLRTTTVTRDVSSRDYKTSHLFLAFTCTA